MDNTDNSKSIRVIPFDGTNWLTWKTKFEAFCEGMDYLQYLSPPSATTPLTSEQNTVAMKAKASLVLSLKDEVSGNFTKECGRGAPAHGLWAALVSFYERKGVVHKHALRRQLYGQELGDDEDMTAYTQRIQQIALQLKNVQDNPSDSDVVYAILEGLPHTYNTIVAQVRVSAQELNSTDLIPILVDHQATIRRQLQESQPKSLHLAAGKRKFTFGKTNEHGQPNKRTPAACGFCGKSGHGEQECWKKDPSRRPAWLTRKLARQGRKPQAHQSTSEEQSGSALSLLANANTSESKPSTSGVESSKGAGFDF